MTLAVKDRVMTVEKFLDWHLDDEKLELIGGIPWRMMSENDLHKTVQSNVHGALACLLSPSSPYFPVTNGRAALDTPVTKFFDWLPEAV